MDTANYVAQRLDGVLLMDQRSAQEVVMLIWLTPGGEDDYLLKRILPRHVIVGALRIKQGAGNGVEFDRDSAPLLCAPGGREAVHLQGEALTKDMRRLLARLKQHLKTPQPDAAMAALGDFADRMGFYVFEEPGWELDFAGRRYPMSAPSAEG